MGLGPGLVVVKRSSQGIEVAPRLTKGRRKVRAPFLRSGSAHSLSGPVALILLFCLGLANSKYPFRTQRLDASCCSHLAPSRHFLASTRVTLMKMGKISSVLPRNLPNRRLVTEIRSNTAPSQRRSIPQSTPRIATDLFRTLTNLLRPKKNPRERR